MRNATIYSLLLFCSGLAFGQQPQWTTVASVVLFNQSQADRYKKTTLLTPTEPGIYRLNVYFSGGGGTNNPNGEWGFYTELNGFDITGQPLNFSQSVQCGFGMSAFWMPQVVVSLKPQHPLTYDFGGMSPTPGCIYNVAITVEQLVQQ